MHLSDKVPQDEEEQQKALEAQRKKEALQALRKVTLEKHRIYRAAYDVASTTFQSEILAFAEAMVYPDPKSVEMMPHMLRKLETDALERVESIYPSAPEEETPTPAAQEEMREAADRDVKAPTEGDIESPAPEEKMQVPAAQVNTHAQAEEREGPVEEDIHAPPREGNSPVHVGNDDQGERMVHIRKVDTRTGGSGKFGGNGEVHCEPCCRSR